MSLSLLIAIFLAFWVPEVLASGGLSAPPTFERTMSKVLATSAAVVLLGVVSSAIGWWFARRAQRRGIELADRRRLANWGWLLDIAALVLFALVLYAADWRGVVYDGLRLRRMVLIDEFLILLPYVGMKISEWNGLYPAERAIRIARGRGVYERGPLWNLLLKARNAWGLILPVAVLFVLAQDLMVRFGPPVDLGAWGELIVYIGLGGLVMVGAPALIRLSWPSKPMPPGPLRARLERVARRCGLRYTDILVWDTGGSVLNAGVTGALPWFRYVLLSDALIENLDPRQVEAVFGHEVGHVAHRHVAYFGLFFLGSMGVMALLSLGIERYLTASSLGFLIQDVASERLLQVGVALVMVIVYFLLIFGYLSRRFERQADVFGCRAVSCGRSDCPPHADVNAGPSGDDGREAAAPTALCPVAIGIFVEALMSVALLNGMEPRAASWRHGSIARRVAFLRGLEGRPEAVRRFQASVTGLRLVLAAVLTLAVILAIQTGAVAVGP